MLPDITVQIASAASPRTIPTDTGQVFVPVVTQRGSTVKPMRVQSDADFATNCGGRLTSSLGYDWKDAFFGEGGRTMWVSRVYGAGAAQATLNLMDTAGTPAVSLVGKAAWYGDPDPGIWANGSAGGLSAAVVIVGSNYQIQVFLNSVLVESSPLLTTQQDAVDWSNNPQTGSAYAAWTLGVSTLTPAAAAAANFAGGTDGSAVGTSDRQAALDRIPSEYGPGQVAAPGVTSATDQLNVIAHCVAKRRYAQLDAPDTASAASLVSAAAALYGAANNGRRWADLLAPWDVIPGLTSPSVRVVPPSARRCAQYARVDAAGNPNEAAAGDNGTAQYVQDLSQPNWIASDRLQLNSAGVTISRRRYGGTIETFGGRNLADQVHDADWSWSSNVRTIMAYAAQAVAITDSFEFKQVDGFGHMLSDWKGALTKPAQDLLAAGALYTDQTGAPSSAFLIDTGTGLNPPSQVAQGITKAAVKLRTSPGAEAMQILITKTPITQSI